MIASTVARVPVNTADDVNERIRLMTEQSVASCAARGPAAIEQRLAELDEEWDVERTLEANASIVSLVGLALGATVDRRWFCLPAAVSGFLLQHAVQGWCPPLTILRRLGVRTASEIDYERYALKAIRGDFKSVPSGAPTSFQTARHALNIARRN
ncbi:MULTISPECIES: hypothetical protein [unclassified Schlesneria]|uniref:hypothetical protein n=1 Tax=Schlesneria TaxID=656899 RepID=UPI002EE74C38